MASTSSPHLNRAGPPTKSSDDGNKSAKTKTMEGLGISYNRNDHTDHTDCSNSKSSGFCDNCAYGTTKSNSPIDHSPELPVEHWGEKQPDPVIIHVPPPVKGVLNNMFRSLSEAMDQLGIAPDPHDRASINQQSITHRPAEHGTEYQSENDIQDEIPDIAQLQKDASAKHATTLSTLLKKYLPATLFNPHPCTPKNQTSAPSILDLEVRRAIASARSNVYLNHIPSKVDREEFQRLIRQSEEENFGHRSPVAVAMHNESLRGLDEDARRDLHARWEEKVNRREGRRVRVEAKGVETAGWD